MPSDTRSVSFAVIQHAFPSRTPGIQLEVPTARRFDSLKSVSTWIRGLGHPMSALAFVSIEILDSQIQSHSRELIGRCADGAPDQLILLLKDPIISLARSLSSLENSVGEKIEKLEFHIFGLPDGIPCITPGTFVEVSHGDTIADDVEWWGNQMPGTIFGHISIEVYHEMLLPEAAALVEKQHHGSPEDLEAAVTDGILSIFRHIAYN